MSLSPLSQSRFVPVDPLPPSRRHVTEHGETLRGIAERLGMPPGILAEANPHVLNVEESMYPGTVLEVPEVSAWSSGPMLPDGGEAPPQVSNKNEASGTGSIDDSGASVGGKGSRSTTTTTTHPDGSTTSATSGTNGSVGVDSDGNASAAGGASHSNSTTTTAANGSSATVGSSVNSSVSVGDGTTTVSGGAEATASTKTKGGSGISFKVGANATASSGTTTENGTTTYTVSGDVSVSAEGGATVKVGAVTLGGSAGHTVGSKTSYTVSMPQEAAQSVDPASVNPYDPTSMPAGTKVTMNGADYAETELAATFGASAGQISFGNKTYTAEGTSTQIEKLDDHTVRVTIGPTEVVSHANSLGVSVLGTGLTVGESLTTNSSNLKTATFDLSSPEGRNAYEEYLATGQLPDDNAAGVADVATISVLDAEAKRTLSVSLFGYDITATLGDSSLNMVQTTYPDGTSDVVTTSNTNRSYGAQLTTTQKVDANGNLMPAATTYEYSLTVSNANEAAQYETAFGLPRGTIQPGQQLTISLTQAQAETLQRDVAAKIAQDRNAAENGYGGGLYGHNGHLDTISDGSRDPYAFAAQLASEYLGSRLVEAAAHPADADIDVLPGTVSVDGTVVKEDAVTTWGTPMERR